METGILTDKEMLIKAQNLLKLNQMELGVYAGVGKRTVNTWMTGERVVPSHVAELVYRIAKADLESLEQEFPTSGMFRWALISSDGYDEFTSVRGSRTDAIREAETTWNNMTENERKRKKTFMVALIHVCINAGNVYEGRFSRYADEYGTVDNDVYDIAKDYLR